MSEIKSNLKLARDAIKKKEYKEALKYCKNVLKSDKDNYNALVFIGVSSTELEQFEQARQAYRKAIAVNKDLILAWQGICSSLEKAGIKEWHDELKDAYVNLLRVHITDNEKWLDTMRKLVTLLKESKLFKEAIDWLKQSIPRYSHPNDVVTVWKDIIVLYNEVTAVDGLSNEYIDEISMAYRALLAFSDEDGVALEDTSINYLEFLCLTAKFGAPSRPSFSDTLSLAKSLHGKHSDSVHILEILCLMFVYDGIKDADMDRNMIDKFEKLASCDSGAQETKLLVSVCHDFETKQNFKEIEASLSSAVGKYGNPYLWFYMARSQHKIHKHKEALESLKQCKECLAKVPFHECLKMLKAQVLLLEGEISLQLPRKETTTAKLRSITTELKVLNTLPAQLLLASIYLTLKEETQCIKTVDGIDVTTLSPGLKQMYLILKAKLSVAEGKPFDAELRLQEAVEVKPNYEAYFLLGEVYWSLGNQDQQYLPKAYSAFVKSAQLDSDYALTFVYLGRYQKEFIKDKKKALKCFEKAFSLDVSNEEAGMNLSDMYLQLEMEDKALKVYEIVTSRASIGESVWAWVRFGLIHMKQSSADRAITCFQHALRENRSISHYWECLAEAYFKKGSYVSALRSFTRALQLDVSSTYSKYMIAKVKQMLRLDNEAIVHYEELLREQPNYVPALLGLAETRMNLEKLSLAATFDGRAVDHAQIVIDTVARALQLKPNYVCLWKTLADSLISLHVVSPHKCRLNIPANLQKLLGVSIQTPVDQNEVLKTALRCYSFIVRLNENVATYWHDLAVAMYRYGNSIKGEDGMTSILQSIKVIEKALSLDSSNHVLWNTLGVITGTTGRMQRVCGHVIDDKHNPGLSQHAFIKALNINNQDGQVWANLGTLYLKHDKIKPAHEAFKRAQACDPSLVQAWIGQATIAETIADDDAMDLFRHATELTFHGEASTSYGQWVCRRLRSTSQVSADVSTRPLADMSHLSPDKRQIVSNAIVALVKYTDRNQFDACAWNTLAILLEHECLYKQAEEALCQARNLLTSEAVNNQQSQQLRMVLLNQARILGELSKYEDATEIYNICSLRSPLELCGLAYVYFAKGDWGQSKETYEKALSISTDPHEQSCILAALGLIAYLCKDADAAKSYLFKSSQLESPCSKGLMMLSALGFLHGDGTLATAALVELTKHKKAVEGFEVQQTMLMSAFYVLQGQTIQARRCICKAVIRYPANSRLWCQLALFLLQHEPSNAQLSLTCSSAARCFGPSKNSSLTDAMTSLAVPGLDFDRLLKSAKRLVYCYPHKSESWVLLASALFACHQANRETVKKDLLRNVTELAKEKAQGTLHQNTGSLVPSSTLVTLYYWSAKLHVLSLIYGGGGVSDAQLHCDQALSSLNGDQHAQEEFIFLKNVAMFAQGRGKPSGLDNIRVLSTLTSHSTDKWKWEFIGCLYTDYNMPLAAELCFREVIKLNIRQNASNCSTLMRMCLLSIKSFYVSKDSTWLERAEEAVVQLLKLDSNDPVVILLRAVVFHLQNNQSAALKYVRKSVFHGNPGAANLQTKFLQLWM